MVRSRASAALSGAPTGAPTGTPACAEPAAARASAAAVRSLEEIDTRVDRNRVKDELQILVAERMQPCVTRLPSSVLKIVP